jgi:DNA-binding MarR family transcriptional regulator
MSDVVRLADVLVRLSRVVERVFSDVSQECGLTPQQVQLLCVLTGGPRGMTELGRLLDLGKSGLTGLVDRVERRALTARTRDGEDRRAWTVALTDQGHRVAVDAHERVCARLDALGDLPVAERAEVAALLARLLAAEVPAPA